VPQQQIPRAVRSLRGEREAKGLRWRSKEEAYRRGKKPGRQPNQYVSHKKNDKQDKTDSGESPLSHTECASRCVYSAGTGIEETSVLSPKAMERDSCDLTSKLSGPPPPMPGRRSYEPAGPLERRVGPHTRDELTDLSTALPLGEEFSKTALCLAKAIVGENH
jgi:hypothetical protein